MMVRYYTVFTYKQSTPPYKAFIAMPPERKLIRPCPFSNSEKEAFYNKATFACAEKQGA